VAWRGVEWSGRRLTVRACRCRRSWYSCDPVELFSAPVTKKVRPDETQKQIEKTLVTEARNSQVRPPRTWPFGLCC
jgi:hypothetical protein